MHRVRAGDCTGGDHLVDVEVTLARRGWSDAHAFVGQPDMHGIGIGRRMHGHCLDAEFLAGSQHTQGDFAAIGYEDFRQHPGRLFNHEERFAEFDDERIPRSCGRRR